MKCEKRRLKNPSISAKQFFTTRSELHRKARTFVRPVPEILYFTQYSDQHLSSPGFICFKRCLPFSCLK